MERKPDFNRLLTALTCAGEPDYLPMMEFCIHYTIKDRFLEEHKIDVSPWMPGIKNIEREVAFWSTAGYDYVPMEISLRYHPKEIIGTEIAAIRESLFLDYTKTGKGRSWAQEKKGAVSSMDDFNRIPWPSADELDYSSLEKAKDYLPPGMKLVLETGRIFQGVWTLTGFEEFCMYIYEQPLLVEKLFETICSTQLEMIKKALQYDTVGAVWIGDDLAFSTSLMISPQHFRKYLFPWFKEIGKACREKNVPLYLHSDGKIDDVIDDIIDCGFCAIHPIEPKAMDIWKTKQRVAGQLAVIGNVDLAYTLTRGTPEEVEAEVKDLIKRLAPGGGYVVGSANSIPDYVPYENYIALIEASKKYGKYPIVIDD